MKAIFRNIDTGGDLPVRRYDAELRYYLEPFAFESECMWSNEFNPVSKKDTRAYGGYVTLLSQISDKLDVVASYDWFDPDQDSVNLKTPDNAKNSRSRTVAGLNYYIDRADYHRIMFDREFHVDTEGPAFASRGWRVRYQYRF